jgi:electron transport complex protein RnfC
MGLRLRGFKGTGTFPRGVHPPYQKEISSDAAVEVLPAPKRVLLPLLQNIGAQCAPIVEPKQDVVFGQKIASSKALISASIHSPISGKVLKQTATTLPNARHVPALPVKAEGDQVEGRALWEDMYCGDWPKAFSGRYLPGEIKEMIDEAGIVGLGGAAFPTHIKIAPNEKKLVDTLLINGCECEPCLTTDYRLMLEAPEPIITGALLGGIATGAKDIVICIEDNKRKAIDAVAKAAKGTNIKVAALKTKYPQGSERHMIMAVLKRIMPLGGLPADVGVAVSNVGTIAAVARAVLRGKPLTHRIVSVTGNGITRPGNLLVPFGVSYGELIEFCGGLTEDAARIVSGGPMMGFTFTDVEMPITKGTGGITILTHEDIRKEKETQCIRCGRCVDVCPMHLVPAKLAHAARYGDVALAEKYNIMGCMESGCCGYICPANIPLVQLIRMGKAMAAANRKKNTGA